MEEKKVLDALETLKKEKKSRKFAESVDLIVVLKELDLKNPDNHIEFFTTLKHKPSKEKKVCALVGPELLDQAKEVCDGFVAVDDFSKYDKKEAKKLAEKFDYFIAQADIMPKVAQTFGRYFGPRKKMPNVKAGCVVSPKTNLGPLCERLKSTVHIIVKQTPIIQVKVGDDKMDITDVAENLSILHNQILHHLPNEKNNIKQAFVKFTMSKPVMLD